MTVVAKLNYLRIAPRKVRLVADLIRGKSVEEAEVILNFAVKKASHPFLKLLNSAIANAKNNFQLEKSNLYISKVIVDEGPKYKRWRARARGRAAEIQKKTSHLVLYLEEIVQKPKKKKLKKSEKPEKTEKTEAPERAKEEKEEKEDKEEKKEEVAPKVQKPKFRPRTELLRPKIGSGLRKIFRRKSF